MLPIQINEIPQSEDARLWTRIEKALEAIAVQEKKLDIDNRDRTANRVLPLAQSYVRYREWANLWNFLIDRNVLVVVESEQLKPKRFKKIIGSPSLITPRVKKPKLPYEVRSLNKKRMLNEDVDTAINDILAVLSDSWMSSNRICELTGIDKYIKRPYSFLRNKAQAGLFFRFKPEKSNITYYANTPDATFSNQEWFGLIIAYRIACDLGYADSKQEFAKSSYRNGIEFCKYFGMEYRDDHKLLKWRKLCLV